MPNGLRTTLWVLSSLAVLWTLLALVGWLSMGGMQCCGMMSGEAMSGGMVGMTGGMMGRMMLHMALTWLVMLGLDGVFIYLLVSRGRDRRDGTLVA